MDERQLSIARARPHRRRAWLVGLTLFVVLNALFAWGYRYLTAGGLRARQRPGPLESYVASELVKLSIPKQATAMKNPLNARADSGEVEAGRALYVRNCLNCHGSDGRGKSEAGGGLYPPPLDLQHASLVQRQRTDGELFYFIRYGVRNTGMPGWAWPDQEIWQVVAYLRNLPLTAGAELKPPPPRAPAQYVGSVACRQCHAELYDRWIKTPMANVVRDPRVHPEAIIPDLSQPNPLVKFTAAEVALTYGSLWKQRYFKKVDNDYYVYPAQWDVTHKAWKPYFVKDDWWVGFYPADNFQRPTSALCDGCHSVNYNIKDHSVTEWNVGCEKCHGPGGEHIKHAIAANILCPSRVDYVSASDNCIQCHSQGRPLTNPIEGKYYDWPVGYDVTKQLKDYWRLEEHKLGENSFTHFAEGTAHKNRMQGNDFVQSQMYTHGVTCFTCHDVHGTEYPAQLRKPASVLCLDCHTPGSPNGPRAPTLEQHTHHAANSAGSQCIACHMPKIAQMIGDVNVRSHTFRFVTPARTAADKVPNACNVCHTDQTTEWSAGALKSWAERSPWRMAD